MFSSCSKTLNKETERNLWRPIWWWWFTPDSPVLTMSDSRTRSSDRQQELLFAKSSACSTGARWNLPSCLAGYFLSPSSRRSEISVLSPMSRRRIPPRHRSRVLLSLPWLGKVNHQQVLVYVLLAQLFTFTANVLQGQELCHGGISVLPVGCGQLTTYYT